MRATGQRELPVHARAQPPCLSDLYRLPVVAGVQHARQKPALAATPTTPTTPIRAGWYIITYGLGIYILNLLIGFLSPQMDPEVEGPTLPTSRDDEFRPFIRRLPEFKFWYSLTKAFCVAFFLTFFSVFNIPVFWPILLMYFIALFVLTMKRQIKHMIKYRYVPFSFGKTRYKGKEESSSAKTAE